MAGGPIRWVFFAYVALIATLTHWPALQIPKMGLTRSDLAVHLVVFGTWAFLCIRCAWFGPPLSTRNIVRSAACAVAYAGLDEATQAIPGLNRYAAWDDFAANTMGIMLGVAAACAAGALDPPEPRDR
jgi:hypothetical protein